MRVCALASYDTLGHLGPTSRAVSLKPSYTINTAGTTEAREDDVRTRVWNERTVVYPCIPCEVLNLVSGLGTSHLAVHGEIF